MGNKRELTGAYLEIGLVDGIKQSLNAINNPLRVVAVHGNDRVEIKALHKDLLWVKIDANVFNKNFGTNSFSGITKAIDLAMSLGDTVYPDKKKNIYFEVYTPKDGLPPTLLDFDLPKTNTFVISLARPSGNRFYEFGYHRKYGVFFGAHVHDNVKGIKGDLKGISIALTKILGRKVDLTVLLKSELLLKDGKDWKIGVLTTGKDIILLVETRKKILSLNTFKMIKMPSGLFIKDGGKLVPMPMLDPKIEDLVKIIVGKVIVYK